MKHVNTLYGQNSEFLNVKAGGTYSLSTCFKGLKTKKKKTNPLHVYLYLDPPNNGTH
jgi:hypothetical protein